MSEALISIKPKYVSRILAGEKTVEVRRRKVNLDAGTRLWIYSTMPEGSISAVSVVKSVEVSCSKDIWEKYSAQTGITYEEFCDYVGDAKEVSAICLEGVEKISPAPTLDSLREKMGKFNPPQFFLRIKKNNSLWRALAESDFALSFSL